MAAEPQRTRRGHPVRTVYNTATSLDGFIADQDNSLEWLFSVEEPEPGSADATALGETEDFIARAGAIVMGATTYEWIVEHESGKPWPYQVPTWVLTHRELPRVGGNLVFAAADSDQELRDLHAEMVGAADGRDVWVVGGGRLAADLARLGLLDEVVVSIAPVSLGGGAPLLDGRVRLRALEAKLLGAFACLRYEVVRD
ncbi:dihydrofolate reductase family protein [Nocardiopsis sp. NRRL B-16309]|uniref:dihydrofolate reductase family protein n=1 Tax=Nocardiopsis sp. NRRL B-16309 TaxID=1519494 RepID=UPI0006B02111|nr:dihydrofolate reductase family protein [Nocardiopsis sp. NRRL B-16309]KOX08883.1 deaminase [Nocardiopsis sp. NRRL B-16309]